MKRLLLLLFIASCTHEPITEPTNLVTVPVSHDTINYEGKLFTWSAFGDASYQFDSYFEVSGVAMSSNDPTQGVTVTASSDWGDVTLNPYSMYWETGPITITCADGWEFYANEIEALRDDLHMEMLPHQIRIWGNSDTVKVKIVSISLQN